MAFLTITFLLIFLPFTFIAYYFTKDRYKNYILLLSSLGLYFWLEPILIMLILAVILLTYVTGVLINFAEVKKLKALKVSTIAISVVATVLTFLCFRYPQLKLSGFLGILEQKTNVVNVIVPFGISIYFFQSLSYTIDLYLGKVKYQKNILKLALYISFFPNMICGPIVRYSEIQNELNERIITNSTVSKGFGMFVRGLGKVVLLSAPTLNIWADIKTLNINNMAMLTSWIGIASFSYGLYFLFSGFSDIGRGLAKVFGFEFPVNFNYPYSANSIVGFWRRWHITLTMWFKIYVIGQMKNKKSAFVLNLLKLTAIWVLTALWHGLSVNFVMWAMFMSFFVVLEKLFLGTLLEKIPTIFRRIYTTIIITIGWAIFANSSIVEANEYIKTMFMFNKGSFLDSTTIYYAFKAIPILIICIFCAWQNHYSFSIKLDMEKPKIALILKNIFEIFLLVICMVIIISSNAVYDIKF